MPTDILRHRSDPVARRAAAPEATAVQHGPGSRVILIRAGRIELEAALAATATAERIWAALPLFGVAEPWGEAIHVEIPIASGRDRTARLMARPGDICLWSEERRIKAALDLCAGCPVRHECLADAKAGRRLVGKQVGDVIGGGGRYDDLMNRFGLDLPAAGFTLYIERIHMAQLERGNV